MEYIAITALAIVLWYFGVGIYVIVTRPAEITLGVRDALIVLALWLPICTSRRVFYWWVNLP